MADKDDEEAALEPEPEPSNIAARRVNRIEPVRATDKSFTAVIKLNTVPSDKWTAAAKKTNAHGVDGSKVRIEGDILTVEWPVNAPDTLKAGLDKFFIAVDETILAQHRDEIATKKHTAEIWAKLRRSFNG